MRSKRLWTACAFFILVAGVRLFAGFSERLNSVQAQAPKTPTAYELPFGPSPFAPSNARTTTGGFIRQDEFIPAARCAGCHKAAHDQWSESLHRNSFREPFYQTNVKHLIRDRSLAVTRHCESCHNPAALLSGALSDSAKFDRPFDEEGVNCSICHSIEATDTTGIGSYVIAPPAMLVREDGTRVRDVSDAEVLADVPSHRRAMMRPLLKTPEFCAACHKAAVVPELNHRKWLRSFAVYDEWQQSAFSNEAVQPLSKRDRESCQSCHMPQSDGIASHRWPGANTHVPIFYGFTAQTKAVTDLLQSKILSVDIFPSIEASETHPSSLIPHPSFTVDVVVANRNVGHAFPAELRDIFEAWLEVKATDATGRVLLHSGEVRPDGTLEPEVHAYRTVPIDERGDPIVRHDIWNTRVGAFDRHIPPGRADLGRFTIPIPADAKRPVTVTARVNYRRFNKHFLDWVSRDTSVGPSPVTEIAQTTLVFEGVPNPEKALNSSLVTRHLSLAAWRAYGIALLDQQRYEAAMRAFERALKLVRPGSPEETALSIDSAATILRMERVETSEALLDRAEGFLKRALERDPGSVRGRFQRAMLNVKRGRFAEAEAGLLALASEYPRDRHLRLQLGGLYLLRYNDDKARAAYERVLEIDPDDPDAHQALTGMLWRFGQADAARYKLNRYNSYHHDNVSEHLRRDYLRKHPELFRTWPWREIGDNPIK